MVLLVIQFLPVSQANDYINDDDSGEVCISIITNDDGGDLIDLVSFISLALDQQIISLNTFDTKCKIFPGFPVCTYSNYFTDIPTPPPDEAAC